MNEHDLWDRFRAYIGTRMGDPRNAHYFATGIDMGLAIALRHPEWAVAARKLFQASLNTASPDAPDTTKLVDEIVESVPIEAILQ